jgi:kynurenine formamidase
VDKFSTEV